MSPKSIDVLTNEISHVKASLDEFKEDTAARFDKFERLLSSHMEREEAQSKEDANDMKNLIAGLEGKYAAKWAEKIIVGGVVMILVSF
jgi:flagellar basal body rod protein FlgG